jgi:hypothetical protein
MKIKVHLSSLQCVNLYFDWLGAPPAHHQTLTFLPQTFAGFVAFIDRLNGSSKKTSCTSDSISVSAVSYSRCCCRAAQLTLKFAVLHCLTWYYLKTLRFG